MTTGPGATTGAGLPAPTLSAADVRGALAGSPTFIALDDDPTGTQTVRDVPVLTRWGLDDVRWALEQNTLGFYILTNTRSQTPVDAATRVREIVDVCLRAARDAERSVVFASRGDSTLRGHFPVEVDSIRRELASHSADSNGIVLAPAYIDAGRVTVNGVHLLRSDETFTPVSESEFARDATFGYTSSRLADWVAEKSGGAISARSVTSIDLDDLRRDGGHRVAERLAGLDDDEVVTLDALDDADLRQAVLSIAEVEKAGRRFVFQVGPSFVRARLGQDANAPLSDDELARIVGEATAHGLVIVGSHVGVTTRQLAALKDDRPVVDIEVDVAELLGRVDRQQLVSQLAAAVADGLNDSLVVLSTSRALVRGASADESLAIARQVSEALTSIVRVAVSRTKPAYVVAKGGITSSDTATEGLRIERAWVRSSLLPGIVSLWQSDHGPSKGLPYVVFAGNVGDDTALARVVARLEHARGVGFATAETNRTDKERQ